MHQDSKAEEIQSDIASLAGMRLFEIAKGQSGIEFKFSTEIGEYVEARLTVCSRIFFSGAGGMTGVCQPAHATADIERNSFGFMNFVGLVCASAQITEDDVTIELDEGANLKIDIGGETFEAVVFIGLDSKQKLKFLHVT